MDVSPTKPSPTPKVPFPPSSNLLLLRLFVHSTALGIPGRRPGGSREETSFVREAI